MAETTKPSKASANAIRLAMKIDQTVADNLRTDTTTTVGDLAALIEEALAGLRTAGREYAHYTRGMAGNAKYEAFVGALSPWEPGREGQ